MRHSARYRDAIRALTLDRARAATLHLGVAGGILAVGLSLLPAHAAQPSRTCANPDALGVSRVVEVDGAKGQVFGGITQAPTNNILQPKEVMLTFDDGPYESLSRRIMDTLDQHCTKATFFVVGQMALARPAIVREEIARGHTVGTHTWSHPMPMKALTVPAQIEEIDKGIAAASRVAGKGLAPFFRFPGLGDSPETLAHLKARGIATFTVDVVSNDSFIADPKKLAERTMNILSGKGRGILLFHDIKPQTAAALPVILDELKRGGYRVVHVVPKGTGGGKRLPTPAPSAAPAVVSSAAPQAERLPWGYAHQGPMPTILPQHVQRAPSPGAPSLGARTSGTPFQGAPQPGAQEPTPTAKTRSQPSAGSNWLESIFTAGGSS